MSDWWKFLYGDVDKISKTLFGHTLHKQDYLNAAILAASVYTGGAAAGAWGAGAGAGAAAGGGAGWALGAGESLGGGLGASFGMPEAASALSGAPGWVSAEGGLGYGNAADPSKGLLGQLKEYGPTAKKFGKGLQAAQKAGLLGGGQQQPAALAAPQPGGGAQMPGGPTSAQIAFPDAYQPAPPYFPLDEILRKRMREGY